MASSAEHPVHLAGSFLLWNGQVTCVAVFFRISYVALVIEIDFFILNFYYDAFFFAGSTSKGNSG
jgi:hypothetical protein